MKKTLLVLSVLLSINNATAQEPTNLWDFRNFDYQSYQAKVQKFVETLTPQEKMFFMLSQSKRDSSVMEKLNEIYEKLDDMDFNLSYGRFYKIKCE